MHNTHNFNDVKPRLRVGSAIQSDGNRRVQMRLRRNNFLVPVPDPFALNSKIPFFPGESDFSPLFPSFPLFSPLFPSFPLVSPRFPSFLWTVKVELCAKVRNRTCNDEPYKRRYATLAAACTTRIRKQPKASQNKMKTNPS